LDYQVFIQNYGYWAVLIGTFLEGETILILGGVAAQLGSLDLSLVVISAFFGSCAGDQLYYFVGRWKGLALLNRFPRWRNPALKVLQHMRNHQNYIILCFRFFYGLRNVTPFVLGIAHVGVLRFVLLNILGAAVWASSFALIGFLLGEAHERILGKGFGWVLMLALILFGVAIWYNRRRKASRAVKTQPTADIEGILP
jgi:membrane protein DedA with SNARE-associated domain